MRFFDPYDYMIREWAPSMTHNVTISGKSGKTTFNVGLGYLDQNGLTLANPGSVAMYGSNTNTNDAPIIRYAEVLLYWVEAKAELGAVTQDDLDKSVNQLRRRPLDATAEAKGIKNTPDMVLADITADFDPARDPDVSPILWEIRRERRMEFVYEYSHRYQKVMSFRAKRRISSTSSRCYRDPSLRSG